LNRAATAIAAMPKCHEGQLTTHQKACLVES
jgi:hypothetical protein